METISWQIYEFDHNKKTTDWSWIVGIVGLTLAIVAVIFNNILFAVLIVVSTFSIIVFGHKEPNLLSCEINKKGVRVNNVLYPYLNLETFNVIEDHEPKLLLRSSKFFMPIITLPIGDMEHDEIVSTLSNFLEHDEGLKEPFAHVLSDYLGF